MLERWIHTIFALHKVQKLWGQPVAELVQC